MERYSFLLRIEPDDYEAYAKRHRAVYPELLQAFREVGIVTYSIFYHEGYLFNYMESENIGQTMAELAAYPVYGRWQSFMSDMLLTHNGSSVSADMPEVFYFDGTHADERGTCQ